MAHVLVVYATRHGSTREVADAMATVARAGGADVLLAEARSMTGPATGWDRVIAGGPIYSGRWHSGAHRFLKRHRRELESVPVAVFALGPRRDEEDAWRRSWLQFERALAKRPWLVPAAVGLFGGADPAGRGRGDRRDLRDWDEIGKWTRKVLASCRADAT